MALGTCDPGGGPLAVESGTTLAVLPMFGLSLGEMPTMVPGNVLRQICDVEDIAVRNCRQLCISMQC